MVVAMYSPSCMRYLSFDVVRNPPIDFSSMLQHATEYVFFLVSLLKIESSVGIRARSGLGLSLFGLKLIRA